MRRVFAAALLFVTRAAGSSLSAPTLHDFGAKTLSGANIMFSSFRGKPVLVLNVAAV
jgi:hypothetical protein